MCLRLKNTPNLRKAPMELNCLIFKERYSHSHFSFFFITCRCRKVVVYDLLRILWYVLPTDASFTRFTRRFNSCCVHDAPIWCTSETETAGLISLISTIINRTGKAVCPLFDARNEKKLLKLESLSISFHLWGIIVTRMF